MAKEKSMIVIKKITIAGAGGHGGSWKVALADFMTAMMAFFLVMWLLGQSEESKKAVSDYFSTPSVIEYNFQNFGVEVTLEKLFLDLVNEPLKAFQSFMEPMDKTPNLLDMGSAKIVTAYLADQLGDFAKNVSISQDGFDFDIPDYLLFEKGSAKPVASFVEVMDKVRGITAGLDDAEIKLTSAMFNQAVSSGNPQLVAQERLDLVTQKVQAGLNHTTTSIVGVVNVKDKKGEFDPSKLVGLIKINIRQKEPSDGKPKRKLETFGSPQSTMNVYDNFVHQLTQKKKSEPKKIKEGLDPNLKNPVDEEVKTQPEGKPDQNNPLDH